MTETEAVALFKCLADKSRLQILKSLAKEDCEVLAIAEKDETLTPRPASPIVGEAFRTRSSRRPRFQTLRGAQRRGRRFPQEA